MGVEPAVADGIAVLVGLLGLGAVYLAAIGWLYLRQECLLFEPERLPPDARLPAAPDVHEFEVAVPGATLAVAQLRVPEPRGVMFFLHGNSGNLHKWFTGLEAYRALHFDLVMFDYRGFGRSTGRIGSEAQLRADVRAVWDAVAARYQGRRVVIAGQSLGTGLAAALSAELCAAGRAPDLTLMVSPYVSMRALADELYPWVPSRVLRYPLATRDHLAGLTCAVMLVHGDRDELIGVHHSEALCQALPGARLLRIEGAGHSDVHQFPSCRQGIASALAAL